MVGKLKGARGSIRQFEIDNDNKYLVSASLDRYARIYSLKDMSMLTQIYCKQKISSLLVGTGDINQKKHQESKISSQ